MELVLDKKLMIRTIGEEEHVYLSSYYFMELNTSRMLLNLDLHFPMEKGEYGRRISELEESMDFQLDLLQKQAVEETLTKGVVVVTGGPGTVSYTHLDVYKRQALVYIVFIRLTQLCVFHSNERVCDCDAHLAESIFQTRSRIVIG